jgi:hypothetical protein
MPEYLQKLKEIFLSEQEAMKLEEALQIIASYGLKPAFDLENIEKELPTK